MRGGKMLNITEWAQGIIIAVIIGTIIEMLLPNNGNGKYVKIVIGIFVMFSIISPIVNKFRGGSSLDINLIEKNNDNKSIQTSNIQINNENTIKNIFEENLKIDIKSKLSQKGYIIDDIKLEIIDNSDLTLNKIEFRVSSIKENSKDNNSYKTTTIVENIENIKVNLGGSRKDEKKEEKSVISESEKRKLKEFLSNVYEVNEKNINII